MEIKNSPGKRPGSIFHFRISDFKFQVSGFQLPITTFQFLVTSFRSPLSSFLRNVVGALVAVLAVACPVAAYAQGCPLCYNTAAAAKASGIQALRSGILILIIPPLLICAGILWRGIKARDTFNEPEEALVGPDRELAELLREPVAEMWQQETGNCKLETRTKERI